MTGWLQNTLTQLLEEPPNVNRVNRATAKNGAGAPFGLDPEPEPPGAANATNQARGPRAWLVIEM